MVRTMIKRRKSLKKAQNLEEKRDRLSELPEPLLHHILSYLPMQDVIRISVLAKRWRHLWLYVPCLNFAPAKQSQYREVAFINRSLLLHEGPKVQKLNIFFKYNSKYAQLQVDMWVHFASSRHVEELHLDFIWPSRYRLPDFIFRCTSLRVLALNRCDIFLLDNFKLSSLKILLLEKVFFFGGTVNDLISSCPVLEYLSLTDCKRSDNLFLSILNASMKTLKIHESSEYSSSEVYGVYAPFTVSFELVTCNSLKSYPIKRMQSLESASFDCCDLRATYSGRLCIEDEGNAIVEILDTVRYVKDLTLGRYYIQALSIREEQSLDSLSFDAKCLRIKTGMTRSELPGIAYILRHSPKIETLIISIDSIDKIEETEMNDTSNCNFDFEDGEYWKLHEETGFIFLLRNLKTIKVYSLMNNLNILQSKSTSTTTEEELPEMLQNDLDFLRFLLKNSKVLKRMIITTCKNVQSKKLIKPLAQKLLAFPRASQSAEIIFT